MSSRSTSLRITWATLSLRSVISTCQAILQIPRHALMLGSCIEQIPQQIVFPMTLEVIVSPSR